MTTLESIRSAGDTIDGVQTALPAVQVGLGTVEPLAETAEEVGRSLRPRYELLVILALAGLGGAIISRRRPDAPDS